LLLVTKFFLERRENEAIDGLPNTRHEADWFEIPVLVIVTKVIGLDLPIEEEDRLREKVFPESLGIGWKCSLVDAEDHETDMLTDVNYYFSLGNYNCR